MISENKDSQCTFFDLKMTSMTSSEKHCIKCNQVKLLSEFNKQTKAKDGYQTYCRSCQSGTTKQWFIDNPDKKYLEKYGITLEDKNNMAKAQGDCCAICRTPFEQVVQVCVDHCHDSDQVRGILCHHCNTGLGQFKDSPKLLQQAAYYIDYHAKKIATASLSTGNHQQGQDKSQPRTIPAAGTREDYYDLDHYCRTVRGEDADYRTQARGGDGVGYGSAEVGPPQAPESEQDDWQLHPAYGWIKS